MDYQFIVGKLSDVIWHSAILISLVGLIKIFLTQYFLYKITVAKKSEIKFTREGGVILRVTGKPAETGRWALAFNVIDSGIGFVHQEEAELYQHFFQVDGSMTREYGGLGIGLAICGGSSVVARPQPFSA